MFFDKNGILDLDGMIVQNSSFKKIMEDGVVTEQELQEQSEKILRLLHHLERNYTEAQLAEIKELLVECGVLYAVYQQYSIQSIK